MSMLPSRQCNRCRSDYVYTGILLHDLTLALSLALFLNRNGSKAKRSRMNAGCAYSLWYASENRTEWDRASEQENAIDRSFFPGRFKILCYALYVVLQSDWIYSMQSACLSTALCSPGATLPVICRANFICVTTKSTIVLSRWCVIDAIKNFNLYFCILWAIECGWARAWVVVSFHSFSLVCLLLFFLRSLFHAVDATAVFFVRAYFQP